MSKTNRWPAWLDLIQGGTGLLLVIFVWAHLLFESSILLGKDAMFAVARMFEAEPLLGKPYPILVSLAAALIFILIVIHALLAMRKFPSGYMEYHALCAHMDRFRHGDTRLWYFQVVTGFLLFFLASIHLYQMIFHPADIGPYASSDRVWSGRMWPLYLVLLFVVVLHGNIGIYRLALKWGLLPDDDIKKARQRLQMIKRITTAFFLILGLTTLVVYIKIGVEHGDHVGERYISERSQSHK